MTDVVDDALGSWGVDMSGPEATTRHVPVAKQLSALARPRRPSDSFDNWYTERPSDSAEGNDRASDGRLLLTDLGAENLMLFAVPTDRGWVCPYLVYDFGELADG